IGVAGNPAASAVGLVGQEVGLAARIGVRTVAPALVAEPPAGGGGAGWRGVAGGGAARVAAAAVIGRAGRVHTGGSALCLAEGAREVFVQAVGHAVAVGVGV